MTSEAFYHLRGGIRIGKDDWLESSELRAELIDIHANGLSSKDVPAFTCVRNNEPLAIYQPVNGRYFLRHYPGSACRCDRESTPGPSTEHRRQAEYAARAAEAGGFVAELEKSTGNGTRLDVGITGVETIGIEIQRSYLSTRDAKARATKSYRAGWPTAWVHDGETPVEWDGHVPTVVFQSRTTAWTERMPPTGSAKVLISKFRPERSGLKWRPKRVPYELSFDDVCVLMPLGEIVPVKYGPTGTVLLTMKSDVDAIESCNDGLVTDWVPSRRVRKTDDPDQDETERPCINPHSTRAMPAIPSAPVASSDPVYASTLMPCSICEGAMSADVSIARGYCEGCRLKMVRTLPNRKPNLIDGRALDLRLWL